MTTESHEFDRALLLTGIMRLVCALNEAEDAVIMEAMKQLERQGAHEKVVNGCRLDSSGTRGQWADEAVVRAVLGDGHARLATTVQELMLQINNDDPHVLDKYGSTVQRLRDSLEEQGHEVVW